MVTHAAVAVKAGIHSLLDRYSLRHEHSDLFGKRGREWLQSLQPPSIEQTTFNVELRRLENLEEGINALTKKTAAEASKHPRAELLMGFTGTDYYSPRYS